MKVEKAIPPERCPITGLSFFMTINHPEYGDLATYGGPYDSYTLAQPSNAEPNALMKIEDVEFERLRYDHDEGCWTEWESLCVRLIYEDRLLELEENDT